MTWLPSAGADSATPPGSRARWLAVERWQSRSPTDGGVHVVKVAYVVGCGHSGTTLVQRLLGAHPRVISVGGMRHLQRAVRGEVACSCGATTLADCSLWGRVAKHLAEQGTNLADLDPNAEDEPAFERDNRRLFTAFAEVTGASVVVDPSRRVDRLRRLGEIAELEVVPVHVFKDPRAQYSSHKRKQGWLGGARGVRSYGQTNLQALGLARRFPQRVHLSYEELCSRPGLAIEVLSRTLDLPDAPEILETWGEVPVHALEGNRMLRRAGSEIRLDESWRSRLNPVERAWALTTGIAVHRACRRRAGSLLELDRSGTS